jgi:transposase
VRYRENLPQASAYLSVQLLQLPIPAQMSNRSISRDLKIAALNLYEHGHLSLKQILACVGFFRRTFFRILKLWRTTGDVVKPSNRTGRPRPLHRDDVDHLVRLIQERPDWFLDELLNLLKRNQFISLHYSTIHRELERAGMSTKVLKEIAEERSEPTRLMPASPSHLIHLASVR